MAYKNIARQKLHDQLAKIAIDHQIHITVDYNQLTIKYVGPIDKVEKARIDTLIFVDILVNTIIVTVDCIYSKKLYMYK